MSELGTMRPRVLKALRPLDAIPVENAGACPGTPDVNFAEGWVELKWNRRWPKRPGTIVRTDAPFEPQQRLWLARRYRGFGSAWLLWKIGREWLLFTGVDAKDHVGLVDRETLYQICRCRWTRGLRDPQLQEVLTRDWESWDGKPIVYD